MTQIPFRYGYRHWWHRLMSSKRRAIRIMNKMAEYWWAQEGEAKVTQALLGAATHGVGYIKLDWGEK